MDRIEQILESLNRLIETLSKPRPIVPIDKQIWDADACAQYLLVSTQHFSTRMACQPDFPACIDISTAGKRNPRWKASEVMRWVDCRQERKRKV